MNKLSPKLKPTISFTSSINFRTFCASSSSPTLTQNLSEPQIIVPEKKRRVKASETQFKENWLTSLSYPFPEKTHLLNGEHDDHTHQNDGSKWILGIDPDVSGAVALLKTHGSVSSAQVFDSPHVKILVGKNKRTRRRLDAKSVVELVHSFDAPIGTTAYIEQSLPYPQDGKQIETHFQQGRKNSVFLVNIFVGTSEVCQEWWAGGVQDLDMGCGLAS